jgi:DNA-binding LacI/PurR family transcriptional regulator
MQKDRLSCKTRLCAYCEPGISGYREALINSGVIPSNEWVHSGDPADHNFIKGVIKDGATAIVCANDLTAANLMKTLDALDYAVPQKIEWQALMM